ncbi:MAG TPA: hypothetical protein VFP42_02805 [Acidimicrobiia bacterium]|nr:hypothetical protein [Acidimicrobiia bacterium]
MNDLDVETVIRGGHPVSSDLIPLTRVVAELRSLAHSTISESFIEFHAAEAAELCAARHVSTSYVPGPGRRLVSSVRRRTATAAATLAMFASATGVAVASDGAVPGDWNYGIDRALEFAGIGAGGELERLHELQVLEGSNVAAAGSSELSARVTQLLGYLGDADSVDGSRVSEIVNGGAAKPEDPGASGRANKPEDPGASGRANQPEDPGASGRANKPEDPGASAGANKPEDPGASGKANKPEDPGAGAESSGQEEDSGAGRSSGQAEDPGASGKANKPDDPGTAAESSGQAEESGGTDNLEKAPASADRPERSSGVNARP